MHGAAGMGGFAHRLGAKLVVPLTAGPERGEYNMVEPQGQGGPVTCVIDIEEGYRHVAAFVWTVSSDCLSLFFRTFVISWAFSATYTTGKHVSSALFTSKIRGGGLLSPERRARRCVSGGPGKPKSEF